MRLLQQAIKDRYVHIDKKQDTVTYLPQGKSRKFSNPEEKVQLETYLELIYQFGYPVEQIQVCERMKIGSENREADIVVYKDRDLKDPFIIVECKKRNVSDAVFHGSIDQGFSYAAATLAQYVWATSGDRDAFFEVLPERIMERESNKIRIIPPYRRADKSDSWLRRKWRWLRNHPILTDTLIFVAILLFGTIALSKAAVEYHDEIFALTETLWKHYGMDFNWIFNTIAFVSMLFTLVFGRVFMRSHQFFQATATRRRVVVFMIALVLFVPVWFIGTSMSDPNWWTWGHFSSMNYPSLIYLWPYVKSLPFQILAIYGLIWLMSRKG
jgi:hypothetical protein